MKAGDLRHRVTIQKRPDPQTQDSTGEVVTAWTDLASVWAAIDPQSGSESVEQDARVAQVTHSVRIRRRADVRPDMRLYASGRTFEIVAVLDSNKPGQVRLPCREVIT
ncbi:MAG: phage head closure protein [Vicinamibacteria bacterium]